VDEQRNFSKWVFEKKHMIAMVISKKSKNIGLKSNYGMLLVPPQRRHRQRHILYGRFRKNIPKRKIPKGLFAPVGYSFKTGNIKDKIT
jgi:hypothetical protein